MQKALDFVRGLFIPHENNNYRARSLHTDFLGFYLVFALALSLVFKQVGLNNVLGFATDISVDKLYQLTNSEREKNGLSDLTYNSKLSEAAAAKANNMFSENYWAHYSPSGKTPWDFILGTGYKYEYAGENLAKNFLFSDGVVTAWMNSPTHRENILKGEYTEVGYAIVNGTLNGEQTTLVVQMFGKPAGGSIAQNPPTGTEAETAPPAIETEKLPVSETGAPQVLAKQATDSKPFNLPNFSFNMNAVFFAFLLMSLGLDFYFASKFNLIRIGGKNIAHFVFIAFMFVGLFIISRGAII
ncbi:MAG: CAP domain-containing protein [Patescibacteria group bacterium]